MGQLGQDRVRILTCQDPDAVGQALNRLDGLICGHADDQADVAKGLELQACGPFKGHPSD